MARAKTELLATVRLFISVDSRLNRFEIAAIKQLPKENDLKIILSVVFLEKSEHDISSRNISDRGTALTINNTAQLRL